MTSEERARLDRILRRLKGAVEPPGGLTWSAPEVFAAAALSVAELEDLLAPPRLLYHQRIGEREFVAPAGVMAPLIAGPNNILTSEGKPYGPWIEIVPGSFIPPGHGSGFNSLDPDPENRGSYVALPKQD